MTNQCREIASSLRVRHRVLHIPWGLLPLPSRPSTVARFENLAREARYHLLFRAMQEEGIDLIAFGHHLDDQVETALLRAARGSTESGVAGMRPFRRWGMGFGVRPGNLGWAGHHGMSKWIMRPLLSVPKVRSILLHPPEYCTHSLLLQSRLIATCKEAGLEYVTDATNAMPDLTLRNQVRHDLLNDVSTMQSRL